MKRTILGLAAVVAMTTAACAAATPTMSRQTPLGDILVAPSGMTLYTYAKDTNGESASACTGRCISIWPPLVAPTGAKAEGKYSLVNVTSAKGTKEKMWAYNGMPLYLYSKDAKPGDTTGNGFLGAWHVVKAGS
jgi:predicted lipoprotein with Yx(FWY)xxD motif